MMKSARMGKCQNCMDSGNHPVSIVPMLVLPIITITAVIISRLDSNPRMINARYAADAMKNASSENKVAESGI